MEVIDSQEYLCVPETFAQEAPEHGFAHVVFS